MKTKIVLLLATLVSMGLVVAYWRFTIQRKEFRSELKRTIADPEAGIEARVKAAAQLYDLDREADSVRATLTEGLEAEYPVSERAASVFVSMGRDAQDASRELMEAAKDPPALSIAVYDQQHWRRFSGHASQALFQIGVKPTSRTEFLDALNDCLQDHDGSNDGQFLELLSIIDSDPQSSIPLHLRAIENGDPAGVAWANEYLIRLDPTDPSAAASLARGLNSESPAVRKWCVAALIKLGPASFSQFPRIAQALHDEDENVVRFAALWMGMTGRRGQGELQRLKPEAWTKQTRSVVDWSLLQDHQEDALSFTDIPTLEPETLRKANRNPTETVFVDALYDSMRGGPVEQITISLRKCVTAIADKRVHPLIRTNTMLSLRKGSGYVMGIDMPRLEGIRRYCPEDVRHLALAGIACLSDGDPNVRSSACRFLEALGRDAEPAGPAIVVQSEYDYSSARTAAKDALHIIAPGLSTSKAEN